MPKKCSVCETINDDGVEFCSGCGVEMADDRPPTISQELPSYRPGNTIEPPPTPRPATGIPPMVATPAAPPPGADPSVPVAHPTDAKSGLASADEPMVVPAGTAEAGRAGAGGRSPRLVIKRYGAISTDEIPIAGGSVIVGRFDPSSGPVDVDVSGLPSAETVSRQHAQIYDDGGAWMVKDLGSSNGVFLKKAGESGYSARLQQPAPLHDNDEVAFGNVVFVFRDT